MNPFFVTDFSISDSLKTVRKSVLIYETIICNSCNGILHMCKDFPKLILEDIAKTCVESNACRYSYFKKLLKNKQNNLSEGSVYKLPEHSNLRGKEEYQ